MFRFLVITCNSFTFPAANVKSCYSYSPAPTGDSALELRDMPEEDCQINRYGYFEATIGIVGKTHRGRMLESASGHPLTSLTLKG